MLGWFGWSQVVQGVKNPPTMQEMQKIWVTSLDQEDPYEECMATHSNILAWKIRWSEKAGGLQSIGLQRIRHSWSNWASTQLSTHTTEHTQTYVLDSIYGFCFCYQRKNMRGGNWFKKNSQRWLPFPYSPLACPFPGMGIQPDVSMKGFQRREAATHRNALEHDVGGVCRRVSAVRESWLSVLCLFQCQMGISHPHSSRVCFPSLPLPIPWPSFSLLLTLFCHEDNSQFHPVPPGPISLSARQMIFPEPEIIKLI